MKLTQERLKELLHYGPDTGVFTWKHRTLSQNRNSRLGGKIAGYTNSDGYIKIGVMGTIYLAHRLAWLYMKGYFPKNIEIDHKDQIPWHNWWDNLRLTSRSCNMKNCGNRKTNTSGIRGVIWVKNKNKWIAQIMTNYKNRYLGCYSDFDDAVCARLAGEQCANWEKCNSNSPAYQYVKTILPGRIND